MAEPPPFASPYRHGFVRVGVCTPRSRPADPAANAAATLKLARRGDAEGCAVLVFPELGISGYAIDDLHGQAALLDRTEHELGRLVEASRDLLPVLALGAGLRFGGRLFNCAVAVQGGRILGVVPKSFPPNYREFYERRWFAPGLGIIGREMRLCGGDVPFGTDLLFTAEGAAPFTFHMEVCEDVWVPEPPSGKGALAGAELLLNLSASNITLGKAETRRQLMGAQSARCLAAYAYSAAGPGESTTDLAWDGHAAIHELGALLAETARFPTDGVLLAADVDVERIRAERLRTGTFGDGAEPAAREAAAFRTVRFAWSPPAGPLPLRREVARFPYVPDDPGRLAETCSEAWSIQVQGLVERLRATGLRKLVIGVSGGLDSTEALIVCCKAADLLGLPRANVLAFTLPGFATGETSKGYAWSLMRALGVSAAEIDIRTAAEQMLRDLGHPYADGERVFDVTFENVQAGLRTDYLFRLAGQHGGLVVGTGDLSELALGWCTYGVGDQMSHYNPNGSVSKTLIQHLIRFAADSGGFPEAADTLHAVLASEISPELVPAGEGQAGPQSTQAVVGPYPLQDFTLFHLTRYGTAPSKIAYLAWSAWGDAARGRWPEHVPAADRRAYGLPEITRWMELFLRRFFANQFKRSAMPNGPKISSGGSLSPRGDWRMPSDASPAAWLDELRANTPVEDPGPPP